DRARIPDRAVEGVRIDTGVEVHGAVSGRLNDGDAAAGRIPDCIVVGLPVLHRHVLELGAVAGAGEAAVRPFAVLLEEHDVSGAETSTRLVHRIGEVVHGVARGPDGTHHTIDRRRSDRGGRCDAGHAVRVL